MSSLSTEFTSLIAEAIGLPPSAFDRFFDPNQQHKLKIVKYPDTGALNLPAGTADDNAAEAAGTAQGVGPHKDSMLTSYLLQVPPHTGLQALNPSGSWIDCPPLPGTFVVAIGQGLEALTSGVCAATTHRVVSPAAGLGPRYSVPFFQGVSYDATFESVECPGWVRELRREVQGRRRRGGRSEEVEFTFEKGRWGHLGEATLMNRVKSHVDVGERWYPGLLARVRAEGRGGGGEGARREGEGVGGRGTGGEGRGVERAVEAR